MATSPTPRAEARERLRDYVRATLFRVPLPRIEPPALVLPRRPGYQSHVPTRSFAHATVLALGARLPDRERSALFDLADRSVAGTARACRWSSTKLRRLQDAALDWLLELLYQQPDALGATDDAASRPRPTASAPDRR